MGKTVLIAASFYLFLNASSFGVVIADSVAEFSGVQGQNNWFYGYYDRTSDPNHTYSPGEFSLMTQYLTTPSMDFGPSLHVPCWRVQDQTYWTALWDTGGHPNGTNGNNGHALVEHWAIRRWVSETSGLIDVSGMAGCSDGFPCTSIERIIVDGSQVFLNAPPMGQAPQGYAITLLVNPGSTVDFAIDANVNDGSDMTFFTASITPEPASLIMIGLAALMCARRKR